MNWFDQPEWKQLERSALELLENPENLRAEEYAGLYEPFLRAWEHPSIGVFKSWKFSVPAKRAKEEQLLAELVSWDRPADCQRFADPLVGLKHPLGFSSSPTINIKVLVVEKGLLQPHFDSLTRLSLPPFDSPSIVIDGCSSGIEQLSRIECRKICWRSTENFKVLDEWKMSLFKLMSTLEQTQAIAYETELVVPDAH